MRYSEVRPGTVYHDTVTGSLVTAVRVESRLLAAFGPHGGDASRLTVRTVDGAQREQDPRTLVEPARSDQQAHARTVDARQLGEWIDTGMYRKGSTLHTAALDELHERALFEAEAREQSDDEWVQGVLAATSEWSRRWPGEPA